MVVYWEYAFLENFLLDGLLLYLAVKCARGRVSVVRLLLSAGIGAAEAIVFPLLTFPLWCAYLVKILGGILLCLIVVSKGTFKTYFVTAAAFFLMTFALGGLLTAAYAFFNVEYEEGNGYLIEHTPVALVFSLAGIFAVAVIAASKRFYRYRKVRKNLFECRLSANGREVRWKGLADSGNCLEFRGEPVCVISAAAVFALYGRAPQEAGRIQMNTVNGGRESPVFVCEKLSVGNTVREGVYLTVGEVASKEYQIILHTALLEGVNEDNVDTEKTFGEDRGKRKRHSLSLRK